MRRAPAGVLFVLGLVGCGGGDASVALIFPNEEVVGAVRRIQVQVYAPSTGGNASSDRDCRDFLELAREGKEPLGTPTRGDFPCPEVDGVCPDGWFEGLELQKIDAGRQIVYVLAYASTDQDATPILDGCTDRFDGTGGGDESQDVPIELRLVIPDSARLVKTAGDRQVGRAGELAAVPLEVEVEADAPAGMGGAYVIPGVTVRYSAQTAGYEVMGGARPDQVEALTGADGRARVGVQLPPESGAGRITAFAPELSDRVPADRAEVAFSLSVTEPVTFASAQVVLSGAGARPVDLALGQLDAGDDPDLVVLSCRGTEEGCEPGVGAAPPFGTAELAVVADLGAGGTSLPVVGELGVLPAAVEVADFEPQPGLHEIAVVSSRRADCQARVCSADRPCPCYGAEPGDPCPCEGVEVRMLALSGGEVRLRARHTMTASNAVGAAVYKSAQTEPYVGLAVAAQGRSKNEQRCAYPSTCQLPFDPEQSEMCAMNPALCGCPPGEACEPGPNQNPGDPGFCVARDKVVDLLEHSTVNDRTYNRAGCQELTLNCDYADRENSTCSCADAAITGNLCTERDSCNCKVPERVHIGSSNASGLPFGVAAGPLTSERDWDMVAPSIGGLELIAALGAGETFEWELSPIVNVPVHQVVIAQMDTESEAERGLAPAGDAVFVARAACSEGANFEDRCPLWQAAGPDERKRGCLGVYFTDGAESLFRVSPPNSGGCRRHLLDDPPDGVCVGRFNADGLADVAVASGASNEVLVFAGDGRGGLLDPPERITLPAGGRGGPMTCGDVDGDGLDDVLVADSSNGSVYMLGTRP